MKGLIIYNGKYGATKQYAKWLSEDLDLSCFSANEVIPTQLNNCDFLLLGTSVYFGKFRIKTWLKRNAYLLMNKYLFLFVVNATSPQEQEVRNKYINDNVPIEIRQHMEIYFVPGRIIHNQLSLAHKLIVKMASLLLKDPKKKGALRADLDEVKKEHILSITKAVKALDSVKTSTISISE